MSALGRKRNIYKVVLKNAKGKKKIMSNKRRTLAKTKIYIDNDLTEMQALEQRNIRAATKELKAQGAKITVHGNKICVDSKWKKWNENRQELAGSFPAQRENLTEVDSCGNKNPNPSQQK